MRINILLKTFLNISKFNYFNNKICNNCLNDYKYFIKYQHEIYDIIKNKESYYVLNNLINNKYILEKKLKNIKLFTHLIGEPHLKANGIIGYHFNEQLFLDKDNGSLKLNNIEHYNFLHKATINKQINNKIYSKNNVSFLDLNFISYICLAIYCDINNLHGIRLSSFDNRTIICPKYGSDIITFFIK